MSNQANLPESVQIAQLRRKVEELESELGSHKYAIQHLSELCTKIMNQYNGLSDALVIKTLRRLQEQEQSDAQKPT